MPHACYRKDVTGVVYLTKFHEGRASSLMCRWHSVDRPIDVSRMGGQEHRAVDGAVAHMGSRGGEMTPGFSPGPAWYPGPVSVMSSLCHLIMNWRSPDKRHPQERRHFHQLVLWPSLWGHFLKLMINVAGPDRCGQYRHPSAGSLGLYKKIDLIIRKASFCNRWEQI